MGLLDAIHTRAAKRASYAALLLALIFSMLAYPILFEAGLAKGWLVSALFLLVLVGCLAAATQEARWFGLVILVVIVLEVLAGLVLAVSDTAPFVVHHVLRAAVILLTAGVLLRDLMRPGSVTADKILGAVCVYFLLALMWAEIYVTIERALPGSFAYPAQLAQDAADPRGITLGAQYFSFVTLTTLGYGDVVPIRALARSVGVLEAVTGQFYIAIVVARLVALYVTQPGRGRAGTPEGDADQVPSSSSSAS